jgi:HAD superfamily phosphatase (TIGR01668 family)
VLQLLYPDIFVEKVEFVDLKYLQDNGYNSLIFDLDNTLVGWRSKSLKPPVLKWLKEASLLNFKMCIVSNCVFKKRVKYFEDILGIPAIPKAIKPRKKAFIEAMKCMNSDSSKTVVIGDQVFTDVLGGNRLGMLTILVLPVDKREFMATFPQRIAEKVILYGLRRKGLLYPLNGQTPKKIFLHKKGNS